MSNVLMLAGLAMLIIGMFGGRLLGVRAMNLLSSEEKLLLLDSVSRFQVFAGLPIVLIMVGICAVNFLPPEWRWPAYWAGWALMAIYLGILERVISGRLRKLGVNADYQKAQIRARWWAYSGLLAFFVLGTLSSFVPK